MRRARRAEGLAAAALALAAAWVPARAGAGTPDAAALYARHCAGCHGADRLGGMGPALVPGALGRLTRERAARVIRDGRPLTQMPAFGGRLGEAEIAALAAFVFTPPARPPRWDLAAVRRTHRMLARAADLPERPVHRADPMNLFVVVELGDHHVTVLDGDRFERVARFPTHRALHGGPKFSPDGRFVYFASRDGWISKYDLWGLRYVAEVRAGINTRNIAVSHDGRFVAVANYLPQTLVILSAADLAPIRLIEVRDAAGERPSRVSAVYTAPPRGSFVAALKDVPEMWEIPYLPGAPPVYRGPMHDWRADSGEPPAVAEGPFPVRRIPLDAVLDDFFFDPGYRFVVGAARGGGARVISLVTGAEVRRLPIEGLPHLGSGISWMRGGGRVLATPNLRRGAISVIDMERWEVVAEIPTLGPGFFLRSHARSPYLWADVFFGPHRDAMHVIDKRTLRIVRTLRPAPGKTSAHVEFTRDGRYALVSVWDMDGAIVVYDARTLEEVRRIPMRKPSGKYNVWNKTHYEEGTSH